MNYLKNHVLASLSLVLICISCKDVPQNNTRNEELQKELKEVKAKLETQKASSETKSLEEFQKKYEVLHPIGAFSTQEDLLQLHIPVASKDFDIVQTENISSKDINAIIVRVTDSTSIDSRIIKDIVSAEQRLTDLKLNLSNLENHQKLKIIVINSIEAITPNEIDALKACIKKDETNYLPKSCWDSIRKDVIPNSKNGDIIIGG